MNTELLAGLSFITVMNLSWYEEGDGVICNSKNEEGKYAGWLLNDRGSRPVFNTPWCFDTAELAEDHVRKVIQAAKENISNWKSCQDNTK